MAVFIWMLLVVSGCDKEVSRSPVESEAPNGFIYINSIPQGFTIFQNSRNTGRLTPDSISYIEAGEYRITLKKEYYKDTSLVVMLNENEKFNLYVDIASNPSMYGGLLLNTVPTGAEITINDSAINKVTPLTLENLLPGQYKVVFSLASHRSTEILAIVQSSNINSYIEELRDTSVWVDFRIFNSGIHSSSLTAICIDNNNVKWMGSLDKGLIKFDEINFMNYDVTNSAIPSNKINCIAVDLQNRVWVGTDFGIGIFDGSGWINYNRNNSGLTSEIINSIQFDAGNTWIGTAGNLVKFDGINWNIYNEPAGRDWINDIYIENDNKLWLGTKFDGIFTFENQNFIEQSILVYGYASETISSIDLDEFGDLWFSFLPDSSGRGGVSFWNGSSFTNIYFGTLQISLNNIFIDNQNNKWIATSEGLFRLDSQNITTLFSTLNSLISANNIRASSRDQIGNVWITTIGGGLNKYKPPQ